MIKKFYKKHEKAIKVMAVAGVAAAGYVIGSRLSARKAAEFVSSLELALDEAAIANRVIKIGDSVLESKESFATAMKYVSDLSEKEIIGLKVWFND